MTEMPMDMPMTDMPGMPSHAQTTSSTDGSSNSHSDCQFPWSSGDCAGMTSCAPNAMRADEPSVATSASAAHDEPVWRADQLQSVARSPEPPPPRA